jgi:hypothetical protein
MKRLNIIQKSSFYVLKKLRQFRIPSDKILSGASRPPEKFCGQSNIRISAQQCHSHIKLVERSTSGASIAGLKIEIIYER